MTDSPDQIGIVFGTVRPAHGAQDSGRSTLKRNMKMMSQSRLISYQIDDLGNELERFNRAQACTLQAWNFQNRAVQFVKPRLRREDRAIAAEMNSRKNRH